MCDQYRMTKTKERRKNMHEENVELVMAIARVQEFDMHQIEATFNLWHPGEGQMRGPLWEPYSDNPKWVALDDLFAQGLIDGSDSAGEGRVWAQICEYRHIHSLDLKRGQACVNTLQRLERGLSRLQSRRGYPTDFADYLMRVAEVLGCRKYATYSKKLRPDGTHDWCFLTPDMLREWVKEHQKLDVELTRRR